MKKLAVLCLMILALGLVYDNSKCLAVDNPEATKKLGGLINKNLSSNQIGEITSLLDQGADINTTGSDNITLLMAASMKDHSEIVKLLLSKGAQVDKASTDGFTPLLIASVQGYLEIVKLLLANGAQVDKASNDGATPLYKACASGHIEIVKLLLSKGAQVDKASNNGDTPLLPASFQGYLEIVKLLLANGAQVNKAANNGATPLSMACASGRLEVVKLLLSKGADINKASNSGMTPLSMARNNANLEIVKLLLVKGAKSGNDSSPLSPLAKEHLGVCLLEMNRRNIGAEPTAYFQDHKTCQKYILKERVAGSFFLTTSAAPCRVLGHIKGNSMVYDGMTTNIENKDREVIVKQYSQKCGKQTTPKVQSFQFKGPAK